MTLLTGRRVVITGGANGIGATIADRFAGMGARGVVLDLPSAGARPPEGWHAAPVDVSEEDSTRAALAESTRLLGGIDAVVSCAGVVPSWQHPTELDLAIFDHAMAVNARGVAGTIKHAAPMLGTGATITVVASLCSWRGDPSILSYAASKHAVLGIVRSAALALGRAGIRVNAVAPGPVATAALRARMASRREVTGLTVDAALRQAAEATALGRIATQAEVAGTIAFLTSDLSSAITGQLINVDGGIL